MMNLIALVNLLLLLVRTAQGWILRSSSSSSAFQLFRLYSSSTEETTSLLSNNQEEEQQQKRRKVTIIGAGWGGLSAAHKLSSQEDENNVEVTVIEANPRVGGVVRDGFVTQRRGFKAEAGQHGFWDNYHNIFRLLNNEEIPGLDIDKVLSDYAEQGQFSPRGLEAVWPIYREQAPMLPTGLAQAAYTRFLSLPLQHRLSAFPLVLAFAEFDDSPQAWQRFDAVSFRDLCLTLGVSRRCYDEALEPMLLTGLFAPGAECSAAAALGMAYFFVLQSQTAFDVRWCKGNIGDKIFAPWVEAMQEKGVRFECSTRVVGFDIQNNTIQTVKCQRDNRSDLTIETDDVIFAVGAKALNAFVRFCPELASFEEFRGFANLRGTGVLATRMFLDKNLTIPFSANACWGFDEGIGMTVFDIRALHGNNASTVVGCPGSVVEVDYYHAANLLVMSDDEIIAKVKSDLDNLFGIKCQQANVVDAAIVRLPEGVNWYFPGSYKDMPDLKSKSIQNLYFAGDIVRTRHGSWSQEKAFVTGMEAANLLLGRPLDDGVLPVGTDEPHVKLSKDLIAAARSIIGCGDASKGPSLVDFLW